MLIHDLVVTGRLRGFSFIEMLAVLCIVGLLFALLVPAATASRNAILRQRTAWQFREILLALESYEQHYGHRPKFLDREEVPIALAPLAQKLEDALQGSGEGSPPPSNPDNVCFANLGLAQNDGRLLDAFGSDNLFLMVRKAGRLAIPPEAFPESIRDAVPPGGVAEAYALWNGVDSPARRGVSWP